MEYNNRLNRTLEKLEMVPFFIRDWMRDKAIGRVVPLVGTAGLRFELLSCSEVVVTIPNRKKIQNHIQQVHATATALLGETASGIVLGMNIPDDKLPLIKSLNVKYIKRSKGDQRASATLTKDQIAVIRREPKGDVLIPTIITDESGEEVVITEMLWAWVTKK